MEAYIGHIITIVGLIIAGALGWATLKNQVVHLISDAVEYKKLLVEQEKRIQVLEIIKPQWDAHLAGASQVYERLGSIDTSIAEIRTELHNRDSSMNRLEDILEANRLVLGELSKQLAVLEVRHV